MNCGEIIIIDISSLHHYLFSFSQSFFQQQSSRQPLNGPPGAFVLNFLVSGQNYGDCNSAKNKLNFNGLSFYDMRCISLATEGALYDVPCENSPAIKPTTRAISSTAIDPIQSSFKVIRATTPRPRMPGIGA